MIQPEEEGFNNGLQIDEGLFLPRASESMGTTCSQSALSREAEAQPLTRKDF